MKCHYAGIRRNAVHAVCITVLTMAKLYAISHTQQLTELEDSWMCCVSKRTDQITKPFNQQQSNSTDLHQQPTYSRYQCHSSRWRQYLSSMPAGILSTATYLYMMASGCLQIQRTKISTKISGRFFNTVSINCLTWCPCCIPAAQINNWRKNQLNYRKFPVFQQEFSNSSNF